MKEKVTVIIPARYGSKRLPGKPLIMLANRPLVLHVVDRAREISVVDKVIVATDDERILKAVQQEGETAVMTPESLNSGTDRVGWVARELDSDIIVNLQGDEPLIEAEAVEAAIQVLVEDKTVSVATLGYPITKEKVWQDPNVVKVITDDNYRALYFSRHPIPYFRNSTFKPLPYLFQHLGVYIFRRKFLLSYITWEQSSLEDAEKLEQLRILSKGYTIKIIQSRHASFGVDSPEDVERVTMMLKQKGIELG
jgi:3-deoxy-manno-octulosonate cytidylyltransferase (CMP-KDO synthetase)